MGAVVRKPAESATKSGIDRLRQELRSKPQQGGFQAEGARRDASFGTSDVGRAPDEGSKVRWGKESSRPMPSQKEPNSEEEDDAEGDPMDTIPADLDYAAFLSSDEDEIDIGSEKKVARVRRLMEQPVDDSAASKRATAGEIRALLKEAHVQSQRMNMQKFLEDCKRRLESDDSLGEPAAGRRGPAADSGLKLPHSYLKTARNR